MEDQSALANIQSAGGQSAELTRYIQGSNCVPIFLVGDARNVLADLPDATFDFCMTSPPYWGKREYASGGIGLEDDYRDYVANLLRVFDQVHRVLKPTGSFWLNIGDTYANKSLLGIPWRIALQMTDSKKWFLRNSVIWNKVKGCPDNAGDKLRNIHEDVFHFVKNPRRYFYDVDAIRTTAAKATVRNGAVVSATGVSGIRYRRQIELSTSLTPTEKEEAFRALEAMLADLRCGRLSDFRMIIRGQQRTTHSDSDKVSGRAREIQERGFYFLKYHPNGAKPADIWDIIPEDTQGRQCHFAPYPEDLCKIPLLATCPQDGIAIDPFCGTGTTMLAAYHLGRKSVGIDVAAEYIDFARNRCGFMI